jgi:hypothetical protein
MQKQGKKRVPMVGTTGRETMKRATAPTKGI